MAWHDKLANLFGWDDAWIALSVLFAVGSILLAEGGSQGVPPRQRAYLVGRDLVSGLKTLLETGKQLPFQSGPEQ